MGTRKFGQKTANDILIKRLYNQKRRKGKFKGIRGPTSKAVRITCDTVADPWYISRLELKSYFKVYYNDPSIHIEILEKEEDNAGIQ